MDPGKGFENSSAEEHECHSEVSSKSENQTGSDDVQNEACNVAAPTKPIYNHSLHLLKQAVQQDKTKHWDSAIKLYKMGVKGLLDYTKYDECQRNEKLKSAIHQKCSQYMQRMQHLKTVIEHEEGRSLSTRTFEHKHFTEVFQVVPSRDSWCLPWERVVGMDTLRERLSSAVKQSLGKGFHIPQNKRNVLLYGPSGAGKSFVLRGFLSGLKDVRVLYVQAPQLVYCKMANNTINRLRQLFTLAVRRQPSVIVLDSMDKWSCGFHHRGAELSQTLHTELLEQMHAVGSEPEKQVMVVMVTNQPWLIPRGMRKRLGLQDQIYIPLPTLETRRKIFLMELESVVHELGEADFEELAARTWRFSPSDLSHLSRSSTLRPLREFATATHFIKEEVTTGETLRTLYSPCPLDTENASQMAPSDIPADHMHIRPVSMDFRVCLRDFKPSVEDESMARFENYVLSFGEAADVEAVRENKKTDQNSLPKLKAACKARILALIGKDHPCRIEELAIPRSLQSYLWIRDELANC